MQWFRDLSLVKKITLALTVLFLAAMVSMGYSDIPVEDLKAKYANEQSKWLDYRGTKVHYRDEGKGPAFFLIHGTAASLHTWDGWVAKLKDKYRLIRLDLPAFGLTGPRPDRDYSIDAQIEVIHALADTLKIKKFHLAGNSLGGMITWRFAVKYPHMLNKIILIDASGYKRDGVPLMLLFGRMPILKQVMQWVTPKFIVASQVRNVYGDPARIKPGTIDRYHDIMLREGNREAFGDHAANYKPGEKETLIKTIKTPTLIMWGDLDRLVPSTDAVRFEGDIENSRILVYEGVGHVPMEEIPEQSALDAHNFLSSN